MGKNPEAPWQGRALRARPRPRAGTRAPERPRLRRHARAQARGTRHAPGAPWPRGDLAPSTWRQVLDLRPGAPWPRGAPTCGQGRPGRDMPQQIRSTWDAKSC